MSVSHHQISSPLASKSFTSQDKELHLSVKRIKEHIIGAEPLGRIDSVDQERVFCSLEDVDVQHLKFWSQSYARQM